ncbi:hypothetical protein KZP52_003354 [Salmonella enterica]|nr:rhodanese-like domain-containing protein [Salmonella enterica]EKQ9925014.1 hypothetical protein [Salmonella enterica subsp. enterica serovar Panama]EHU8214385.1 hypothetical protein [Salmonella enterica]EJC4644940.1 hypothetical protein [Salmonella enterica]EJE2439741.1 hypothetical protein [Salmonella enterica]ELR7680966.1 hypothetical protein [Salmonella enterica]
MRIHQVQIKNFRLLADVELVLEEQTTVILLDVQESAERKIISIGGKHIPLREVPDRIAELPQDQLIVCYCKFGSRSKRSILFLQDQGFTRVVNLAGGIMGLTQSEKQSLREWGG